VAICDVLATRGGGKKVIRRWVGPKGVQH